MNNKYYWDLVTLAESIVESMLCADFSNLKIFRINTLSIFHAKQQILCEICHIHVLRPARAKPGIVPECEYSCRTYIRLKRQPLLWPEQIVILVF